MSSAAQAIANKQNAQSSTGPRTPEGKRQSSRNSIRHGLTGQTVVLPGEDREAYESLRAELAREYDPQTIDERILVQTIGDCIWRLERAHALEANLVQLAHHEEIPPHIAAIADPARRAALLTAHGYDKREKQIRNLQLQGTRLQRTLSQSMESFHAMRNSRIDNRSAILAYAAEIREAAANAGLPFEPAVFGFDFTETEIDHELKRRKLHSLARRVPNAQGFAVSAAGVGTTY